MKVHAYYVYIVASHSRVLYTGFTSRLEIRVQQHREGTYGGFTSKYKCNRLVWYERYQDVHRAIAREKEIKGWLRKRKVELIESKNPAWADLSLEWNQPVERYQSHE